MAEYLKRGKTAEVRSEGDAKVRGVVEGIPATIAPRGDADVPDLLAEVDDDAAPANVPTPFDIAATKHKASHRQMADIRFARAQIRGFAEDQRASIGGPGSAFVAEAARRLFGRAMTDRGDWCPENLTNCGALFLGPRTSVTIGDKAIGTNHSRPPRRGGHPAGGLWVGKVRTDEAAALVGANGSRLCLLEGCVGHAKPRNLRVRAPGGLNVPSGTAAPDRDAADQTGTRGSLRRWYFEQEETEAAA